MSTNGGRFRTVKQTSWKIQHASGELNSAEKIPRNHGNLTLTDLDWQADGGVTEQESAVTGRLLTAKASGFMNTNSHGENLEESRFGSESTTTERFRFFLVDRPVIILHSPYGYVGLRQDPHDDKLVCNRDEADAITAVPAPHGGVYLRAVNGKYLRAAEDGTVWADSQDPTELHISVHGPRKIELKTVDGKALQSNANGFVTLHRAPAHPTSEEAEHILWSFSTFRTGHEPDLPHVIKFSE